MIVLMVSNISFCVCSVKKLILALGVPKPNYQSIPDGKPSSSFGMENPSNNTVSQFIIYLFLEIETFLIINKP